MAKSFQRKFSKHERTTELAKSKLSTIVDLVSKALNDGKISPEEFSLITSELTTFRRLKAEIRATRQVAPAPPIETTAEVTERVRIELLKNLGSP